MAEDRKPGGSGARPQDDAKPQFKQTRHGGDKEGVMSADPKALSKKENGDSTFTNDSRYSTRRE